MIENEMPQQQDEVEGVDDAKQELADRMRLGSMRIDRTAHYDEEKKAKIEAQLKAFQKVGSVPFKGEDES